jgi:hypothetical protein
VSLSSEPRFPTEVGSGGSTYLMAPGTASLRESSDAATGIKIVLAGLVTQLGLHIFKIRSRVTETSAKHTNRRRHHYLQDVRTGRYNAAQ